MTARIRAGRDAFYSNERVSPSEERYFRLKTTRINKGILGCSSSLASGWCYLFQTAQYAIEHCHRAQKYDSEPIASCGILSYSSGTPARIVALSFIASSIETRSERGPTCVFGLQLATSPFLLDQSLPSSSCRISCTFFPIPLSMRVSRNSGKRPHLLKSSGRSVSTHLP